MTRRTLTALAAAAGAAAFTAGYRTARRGAPPRWLEDQLRHPFSGERTLMKLAAAITAELGPGDRVVYLTAGVVDADGLSMWAMRPEDTFPVLMAGAERRLPDGRIEHMFAQADVPEDVSGAERP